ncbi:zinc finger MYM-type 2-like [Paramuricea clavata]|uniref:Zinc finger MYM-type 2-like n=1 Tax=Paramuricea clavata TaxID=317549 RepID=A0A7D9D7L8_PARCT|nr:zinc finger MYM-type 2-like [Paramuricea clavata]
MEGQSYLTSPEELGEIQSFIERQRPDNTKKKTMYDIKVIKRYFESIYETREIENIPATELNVQLAKVFMNVRKRNGNVYESTSLKDFQRSLQRYLNDKSSTMNILQDQVFAKSREVHIAKKRELVQQHAKGNRPQACRELTTAEEDKFFELGLFGKHDPEVLQRTVWWVLSLHFGFRARDESRKLKWGDVSISKDPETGSELLLWKAKRAQATHNERCPVQLYRAFSQHRPDEMKQLDSSFFLAINHRRQPGSQIWYNKAPLGKNENGKFLLKAAKAAKLSGNITNPSVRKTCISRLMDADIPENYVAQLSGHKNLKSLDSYKSASTAHQRKMSFVFVQEPRLLPQTKRQFNQMNHNIVSNNKTFPTPTSLQSNACFQGKQFKDRRLSFQLFSQREQKSDQSSRSTFCQKKACYLER